MSRRTAICALFLALGVTSVPENAKAQTLALVHFNIIPMTRDTVLRDYSVVVTNGLISTVAPAGNVRVPPGGARVDGGGTQYIVPALADMHMHTTNASELAFIASYGVLTILNMGWSPEDFVARERHRYEKGELFGPTVFEGRRMNWPHEETPGIATVQQARDTVRFAERIGYEFIKVYSFLSDSVFDAIMKEAAAVGMPVVGHQTFRIGLPRAIRSGLRMVAHAEELGPAVGIPLRQDAADSIIPLFTQYHVWLTPTLAAFQGVVDTWASPARLEQDIAEATTLHVPSETLERWRQSGYQRQTGSVANRMAVFTEITRQLYRSHVPFLAGTDGPTIPGLIPGLSINDELRALRSVGLSNYEALATATSNPGRFIAEFAPKAVPFGTVTNGVRADLVILTANPLQNLEVLRTPTAVVRLGRLYTATQLDSIRRSVDPSARR